MDDELKDVQKLLTEFQNYTGFNVESFSEFNDLKETTERVMSTLITLINSNILFVNQLSGQIKHILTSLGGGGDTGSTIIDPVSLTIGFWKQLKSQEDPNLKFPEDNYSLIALMAEKSNPSGWKEVSFLWPKMTDITDADLRKLLDKGPVEFFESTLTDYGIITKLLADVYHINESDVEIKTRLDTIDAELEKIGEQISSAESNDIKQTLRSEKQQIIEEKNKVKIKYQRVIQCTKDLNRKVPSLLRIIYNALSIPYRKILVPLQKRIAHVAIICSSAEFIPQIESFHNQINILTSVELKQIDNKYNSTNIYGSGIV